MTMANTRGVRAATQGRGAGVTRGGGVGGVRRGTSAVDHGWVPRAQGDELSAGEPCQLPRWGQDQCRVNEREPRVTVEPRTKEYES